MTNGFMQDFFALFYGDFFLSFLNILLATLPIWMPIFIGALFWTLWMRYQKKKFILERGSVLLEIKLPPEVTKSPLAMEIFFTSLYQTGAPKNWIETYLGGSVPPWFSLELVSLEGEIHFFIWSMKKYKNMIEAQLYAQYPNAEIHEVSDYTGRIHHGTKGLSMWGTYFKLSKPDPYPIKTYIDYGLDQDIKEEFKIDPMTSVLEYLGSIGKGEQIWIQILIQAHLSRGVKYGHLFKTKDWKVEAKQEIEKIREEATPKKVEGTQFPGFPNPTKGQTATIAALERSMSKFPFDCAIRGFYIWEEEHFNDIAIPGLIGTFRQYSDNDLNGFQLGWYTDTDGYPWQDFMRIRRNKMERKMLDAYKRRSFFQLPYRNFHAKPFILTTEELATIFHLPGQVAQTPTLPRVQSKRGEAPSNLPRQKH